LKVSSSAVTKNIKGYDETVSHEDRHRKGRPRVTSAVEDKFTRVSRLRLQPKSILHRVQVTDTSQHQLFRGDDVKSGLHGQIAAKKPLLKGHQEEEETCLGQETRAMEIRPVGICPSV
jgi:hypothetical protein